MAEDHIRYDVLVQEALRGVVRKVLTEVARAGLPGDHHFYIAFDTRAPGVRISSRLQERYPEEMTVILQHQYWDLSVTEHAFEVGLSFSGVPERLLVPFTAIKGLFDPSVKFGLEFEVATEAAETGEAEDAAAKTPGKAAPSLVGEPQQQKPAAAKTVAASEGKAKAGQDAKAEPAAEGADEAVSEDGKTASVVSLDAFRKKT